MKTKTWEDEDYVYTVSAHAVKTSEDGWEYCLHDDKWAHRGSIALDSGLVYRKKKLKLRIPTVVDIRASGYELKCSNNHHTVHIIAWYYISSGLWGVSSCGPTWLLSELTIPDVTRPRAEEESGYYYINNDMAIEPATENLNFVDYSRYDCGNYYLDESIAKKAQRYLRGE